MSKEELEGLTPEEKIKRLKELEKKKKEEIDEARKLLKESEEELSGEEEFKRKVPIPEIAKEDLSTASEEEKEILKTHKGLREDKGDKKSSEDESSGTKKESLDKLEKTSAESLEEIAFRERVELPQELINSQYAERLSQQPMQDIYQEIKNIYQSAEEKGYVSPEQERKIQYLSAATERKLEDVESGEYSLTEEVARAATLTKSIGASLMDSYKRGSGKKLYQR